MHIKRYEVSDLGNKSHFFAIAIAVAVVCRRYSIVSLCCAV